eukprot:906543-Prymnesium_polylepis.1
MDLGDQKPAVDAVACCPVTVPRRCAGATLPAANRHIAHYLAARKPKKPESDDAPARARTATDYARSGLGLNKLI